jgi:hypothetical protein
MESLLVEGIVFIDNVLMKTDNGIKLMILYEDKYLNVVNYDLIFNNYFECYTNEELIKIKNMIDENLKNPFIDINTFNILLNKINNEIKITNDLIDKYNNLLNANYDKLELLNEIGYTNTEQINKIKDLYNFKNKYNKLTLHKIKNNDKIMLYRLYGQQYFEIKFSKFLILKDIKLIKELDNIKILLS